MNKNPDLVLIGILFPTHQPKLRFCNDKYGIFCTSLNRSAGSLLRHHSKDFVYRQFLALVLRHLS